MGDRVPLVVGVLAIVAVVAWLVIRDHGDTDVPSAPAHQTTPAKVTTPTPTTPPNLRTTPSLPADTTPSQPADTPTANDVFETEPRDDAWAAKTEAELAQRLAKIRGGKIDKPECHQTQCRVVIAGNEQDVGASVADLEGSRGLHGYAKGVLLTSPERNANGDVSLRVFVQFAR